MKSIKRCTAIGLAVSLALATAAAPQASSGSHKVGFDIDAPSLVQALSQFTQQSGLQLLVPADGATEAPTPSAMGSYTPRQALDALLAGTAFEYEFANPRTAAIADRSPGAQIPPEPLHRVPERMPQYRQPRRGRKRTPPTTVSAPAEKKPSPNRRHRKPKRIDDAIAFVVHVDAAPQSRQLESRRWRRADPRNEILYRGADYLWDRLGEIPAEFLFLAEERAQAREQRRNQRWSIIMTFVSALLPAGLIALTRKFTGADVTSLCGIGIAAGVPLAYAARHFLRASNYHEPEKAV